MSLQEFEPPFSSPGFYLLIFEPKKLVILILVFVANILFQNKF